MQYNTGEGQVKATVAEAVESYRDSGLGVPFPLPYGEKKEPPRGVTGKSVTPEASAQKAEEAWKTAPTESNIGLRLAPNVFVLDEDAHDDKPGAKTKKALENKLVPLPSTWSCTRHGADAESRHHYFTAPEGLGWKPEAKVEIDGKTFGAIDVRHMRLSYLVVWPSQYDGDAYQWYTPTGELSERPPRVDELAELPPVWIEYLSTGAASDTSAVDPTEMYNFTEAMEWLETTARAYDSEPGAIFQSEFGAGKRDDLRARFDDSAHPTMVERQTWAVKLAVFDGEAGLETALGTLEEMFCDAVSRRASHPAAVREWRSALTGAVNLVRGEVEAGRKTWKAKTAGLEALNAVSIAGACEVHAAVEGLMTRVEELMWSHGGDDLPAQLLLEFCADFMAWKLDLHNNGGLSLFDVAKGEEVPPGATFRPYLRRHVLPVVKAYRAQLPDPDTLEDDTEKAQLKALLKKCSDVLSICESENRAKPVLSAVAGLLAERGEVLKESDADKAENLLGLSDGHVIDLNGWWDGKSLPESMRPRARTEIVTKSLRLSSTEIRAGVARLEAGETAPVAELFRLVFGPDAVRQTVLELMAYSLHGSNPHRLVWGIQGDTGTGKSTVMGFLTRTLGGYAAPTTMAALSDRSGGNNSAKAAALRARLAFTEEFSQDTKGNRDALKEIASNVHVSVTDKFKCSEEHRGTVIAFTTNEPARVDFDAALEDRFVVVPTACTQEQVNALLNGFEQGWDTDPLNRVWLLSMLADAYARPWSEGFRKAELPTEIQECTSQFVAESNPAHRFITESVEVTDEKGDVLAQSRLIEAVKDDCGAEITAREMQTLMVKFGAEKARVRDTKISVNAVAGFRGVKFREAEDSTPPKKLTLVSSKKGPDGA